jgi:hypothetical protein
MRTLKQQHDTSETGNSTVRYSLQSGAGVTSGFHNTIMSKRFLMVNVAVPNKSPWDGGRLCLHLIYYTN